MSNGSNSPQVFVSYSHDDEEHKAWVLRLATDLRSSGVNAVLDQWDLRPGQDSAQFMERGVAEANRVIIVCSETYVQKANTGTGGVGYEKMVVTSEIVANMATNKFLPIIRNNKVKTIPAFLGTRFYIDFEDDTKYQNQLELLLREIHEAPRVVKPPIGPNPFARWPGLAVRLPSADSKRDVFADPWFNRVRDNALPKVLKYGKATMEVAFGAIQPTINADQRTLLDVAERSAIHTFGWPIGVVLPIDDSKPRPVADGILAEIVKGFSSRDQVDYWMLRRNGDFYVLQNIFEDERDPSAIFFNTRIVRVAESILYCCNLYNNLGFPAGTGVEFRIRHTGLKGRKLSSSNQNRIISPPVQLASEDAVETKVWFDHPVSDNDVVRLTQELLDPLFMMFDFFKLNPSVYDEIVKAFINGRTT